MVEPQNLQGAFYFMAHTRILFLSTEEDGTSLDIHCNQHNRLFIAIEDEGVMTPSYISLDLSTAKALLKQLKAEIKQMECNE